MTAPRARGGPGRTAPSTACATARPRAGGGRGRAGWTGKDGALEGLRDGAVAIECSTVSPEWVTELAGLVEARGGSFLDAPVTGSKPQAGKGGGVVLVGGGAGGG